MSSIIDALKKSDANRPRTNHGLKMNVNLSQPAPKKGHYLLLGLLLLVIIAVAASWYFKKPAFIWHQVDTLFSKSLKKPVQVSSDAETANITNKSNPRLAKPEPKKVKNKAQLADAELKTKQKTATKSTPVTTVKTNDQSTLISNTQTETSKSDVDTSEPINTETMAETQNIDAQLSATPMKNKQAIKQPADESQTKKVTKANLPQLFELPYTIRKDLPKLNLSVHVFDPIVENRMVIINGVSIHVGDTLNEQVTIKDITQSGVVLNVANRDFIILK